MGGAEWGGPEGVGGSGGVMGGGGVGVGNDSAVAVVAAKKNGVWGETVSSRLGLRTEISARYYRETTRTDVPQFLFS